MTPQPRTTKVVVVDDHSLFAESLQIALEMEGYSCKLAQVSRHPSLAVLLAGLLRSRPHLVLLDLDLGAAGDATRMIQPLSQAGIAVVVVTGSADRLRWGESLRYGARKVLSKSEPLEGILLTIRRVANGLPVLPREERDDLLRIWHEAQGEIQADRDRLRRLTAREAEVLGELMRGQTVADIARRRFVSEATVRTQVKAVLSKLDVSSQIAAVGLAHRAGWLAPTDGADPAPSGVHQRW